MSSPPPQPVQDVPSQDERRRGDGPGATCKCQTRRAESNVRLPENTTLSLLQSKQKSVQDDLDTARQKLLAARQGQRLEEDQQSERFEVIEQPTAPQEPVKPNRKKMLAMGFALSIVAGFGGVFAIEAYDKTIRGTTDLPMPTRFVVTIPYISTRAEVDRARKRLKVGAAATVVAFIVILALIHFLVLPLDLVFEKLINRLIG